MMSNLTEEGSVPATHSDHISSVQNTILVLTIVWLSLFVVGIIGNIWMLSLLIRQFRNIFWVKQPISSRSHQTLPALANINKLNATKNGQLLTPTSAVSSFGNRLNSLRASFTSLSRRGSPSLVSRSASFAPVQRQASTRRASGSQHAHVTSSYVYLFVLSCCDLVVILSTPILVHNLHYQWRWGWLGCKMFILSECLNKYLSPFILTLLSLDRFIAICTVSQHHWREPRGICKQLAVCLLLFSLFAVPLVIYADTQSTGSYDDSNSTAELNLTVMQPLREAAPQMCAVVWPVDWEEYIYIAYDVTNCLLFYLVPLVIIVTVYSLIMFRLWSHTRHSSVGAQTAVPVWRVARSSAMVVGFYFIVWTPYHLCRVIEGLFKDALTLFGDDTSSLWTKIIFSIHVLPYAQAALNWMFYALMNRNLRQSASSGSGAGQNRTSRLEPPSCMISHNPSERDLAARKALLADVGPPICWSERLISNANPSPMNGSNGSAGSDNGHIHHVNIGVPRKPSYMERVETERYSVVSFADEPVEHKGHPHPVDNHGDPIQHKGHPHPVDNHGHPIKHKGHPHPVDNHGHPIEHKGYRPSVVGNEYVHVNSRGAPIPIITTTDHSDNDKQNLLLGMNIQQINRELMKHEATWL